MTVTFQSKITERDFITKHWKKIPECIKEEINKYNKIYIKSIIKSSILLVIITIFLVLEMWTTDSLSISNLLLWILCEFGFMIVLFVFDMIEFPSCKKWLKKAHKQEKKFIGFNPNIDSNEIEEIYTFIKNNNAFNSDSFNYEKRMFCHLYTFESIKNYQVVEVTFNKKHSYTQSIKYIDEDGIIYKIWIEIPVKKSVKLSENHFLIQMTENGLQFIIPTREI